MKTFSLFAAAVIATLSLGTSTAAFADSQAKIDKGVSETLVKFHSMNPANKSLGQKAAGILVFPKVTKAGVGVAGEHGEGALQVNGKTVGYYSLSSASVGLTLGVASHGEIIMFMTKDSLDKFSHSDGWSIGADAEITVVKASANGEYDSRTQQKPVLAFVFSEKGLIGDLSLEGSKITKLVR